MKTTVMALVVRDKINNAVIDVYPVRDMYSHVQVEYSSEYVTPQQIREYVESWMGKNNLMAIRAEESIRNHGLWRDEQEAKDFQSVGNLIISLEEKEIDWS